MKVAVTSENSYILECFSSSTRIKMIELLQQGPMNIKMLSEALEIKSPIVTRHIQMLEDAGIVRSELIAGKRGQQKLCHLQIEEMTLTFRGEKQRLEGKKKELVGKNYVVHVPVGKYSSYNVQPSCGMASQHHMLGMCDDPRYFADPIHVEAQVLWFSSGYVEYRIPNYMIYNDQLSSIEVSMEICSETPCSSTHMLPSDIIFSINDIEIGTWTYPGQFVKGGGIFTPEWWHKDIHHGIMKHVRINKQGSFIDGVQVSEITINDLNINCDKEIMLRIACSSLAKHRGGVTLFGKGFGNYDQDIQVVLHCK